MRIFSLTKINSGPECVGEIEEAEECCARHINNNNINNTFDFILKTTLLMQLHATEPCLTLPCLSVYKLYISYLYPTHPSTLSKVK